VVLSRRDHGLRVDAVAVLVDAVLDALGGVRMHAEVPVVAVPGEGAVALGGAAHNRGSRGQPEAVPVGVRVEDVAGEAVVLVVCEPVAVVVHPVADLLPVRADGAVAVIAVGELVVAVAVYVRRALSEVASELAPALELPAGGDGAAGEGSDAERAERAAWLVGDLGTDAFVVPPLVAAGGAPALQDVPRADPAAVELSGSDPAQGGGGGPGHLAAVCVLLSAVRAPALDLASCVQRTAVVPACGYLYERAFRGLGDLSVFV
jgi:hypothetical protein